ncbi:monoglyceride lipase-like [Halichondria panicea]|uniref:monoglyceride lipase-like n=1 Tax=Halichondria panicea TaxID=6063 RepID=UPI00312B6659
MATQIFRKTSADSISLWMGHKLHIIKWEPQTPNCLLFISHGACEHMGRYNLLAEYLAAEGILVFGHDHVGHGRSEGDRAHIEHYGQYVQDVIQTVEETKKQFPELPCYLMGHSMGGLIAGLTVVERQDLFKGLILSAALVEVDPNAAGWFIKTVSKVVAVLAPQLGIKKLNTDDISSVPEEVQAYVDDELIYHGSCKAKWATASLAAIAELREQIKRIHLPLLLIHGIDDKIVPISGSEFIASNVSSPHLRFERFDGNRHEVFHDTEQTRAREVIKEWIFMSHKF